MKKVIAILAIGTTLVACGGNASTEVKTDSTAVSADSTQKDTTAYKAENAARLSELKDTTATK